MILEKLNIHASFSPKFEISAPQWMRKLNFCMNEFSLLRKRLKEAGIIP